MMILTLPWPNRVLHPNSRPHWAALARERKKARAEAFVMARHAGFRLGAFPAFGPLHLWLDFFPPDHRKRDDDGLVAAFKPYRDGIADALGVDDSRFVCHPCIKTEILKGGAVRVNVTGGTQC